MGTGVQQIGGDQPPAGDLGRRELTAPREECRFQQQRVGIKFGLPRPVAQIFERIGETFPAQKIERRDWVPTDPESRRFSAQVDALVTGLTTDAAITYVSDVAAAGQGGTPTGDTSGGFFTPGYVGPNFDIAPVPGLSKLVLLAAGLCSLGVLRRKRAR
jgi:hypothetical protein